MSTSSTTTPARQRSAASMQRSKSPLLTIFALPKPFLGHIGVIQRNAIRSWTALGDEVEVILFGDEVGTAQYARELGVRHVPEIRRNEQGTPLLDDVFATATATAKGDVLLYANSDIVFTPDLVDSIKRVRTASLDQYLLIGRRVDLDVTEMIDFEHSSWEAQLIETALRDGTLAPVVCKDYFGFERGQYASIPAFAVGRGNWDNWMVHHANEQRIPVIDCTESITAIHQNHGYQHLRRGRLEAYVNGAEAEENRRLAGGRHLVSGSGATWQLNSESPVPLNRSIASSFYRDLPGFVQLLGQLFLGRKPSRRAKLPNNLRASAKRNVASGLDDGEKSTKSKLMSSAVNEAGVRQRGDFDPSRSSSKRARILR